MQAVMYALANEHNPPSLCSPACVCTTPHVASNIPTLPTAEIPQPAYSTQAAYMHNMTSVGIDDHGL